MVTQYVKLDFFGESLIHKLISLSLQQSLLSAILHLLNLLKIGNPKKKKKKTLLLDEIHVISQCAINLLHRLSEFTSWFHLVCFGHETWLCVSQSAMFII